MVHSTIKKILGKKGTKIARNLKEFARKKKLLINVNNNSFKVDSTKHFWFWKEFQSGNWEPKTIKILDLFLDKNHSYIDIGAWIGSTVLYACQLSSHCYALEPDPNAYSEIKKNIALNEILSSKITLFDVCMSNHVGTTHLYCPDNSKFGNSKSTILEKGETYVIVKTLTMNDFIRKNHINDCNFIKMDIEGGEFVVLLTMLEYLKKQKPTLLIEFHPLIMENPKEKLENMRQIFELYKNIYNYDLKKISINQLFDYVLQDRFYVILSETTI